jgi:membrane protein YqaA with SNARE-associated domain
MRTRQIIQSASTKIVLRRRSRRRFNLRNFIDRTVEAAAIVSLLITGFSGVGAMACWGMEIVEMNANPNITLFCHFGRMK